MGCSKDSGGFTLIELSIVLIIIGLLAGAIMVGNDLILAARIRAQISQIRNYTAAVNTFRGKYGNIPGDLTADKAASYGFTDRTGGASHGDGNGTLESCSTAGVIISDMYFGCETALFWRDLSQANLIDASLNTAIDDFINIPVNGASLYLPEAKLGGANYLNVFSDAIMDVFSVAQGGACKTTFCFALSKNPMGAGVSNLVVRNGVTPGQAYAMDSKLDDALPLTGMVLAGSVSPSGIGFSLYYIPGIANTRCIGLSGVNNSYNTDQNSIDQANCIVNFVYR